ncbi:Nicotinamide-nucleotide amidohydrolase PncC [Azoarcus sp. Aa7]|nr:Nicotinamide-nucleotide amidohydrolase PncC [Azoarcus sp. Aa7]
MIDEELHALSRRVGDWLAARGATLACAESCTGGWVAQTVTATAGSSGWFDRGFVTYSNEAKQELLGVAAATLTHHGAVSEETVREMVAGTLAHSRARYALAVSGVAGPGGGTAAKPVGMVCFAWGERGADVRSATVRFDGDRTGIRRQAVIRALAGLMT